MDDHIRSAIKHAPTSVLTTLIDEYIHDERNRAIAVQKIIQNRPYEMIAEMYGLSAGQIKNIIKSARRTIYEHL